MTTVKKTAFSISKRVDWFTVVIYLLLVIAGWVAICGASYDFDLHALFTARSRPMMQLIWIGMALMLGYAMLLIDTDFLEDIAPYFYFFMLLLLAATIFLAPNIKGSHSWLVIGPLRLQPAEFGKLATALMLAWQVGKEEFKIEGWRNHVIIFAIILTPILLILLQSETGSAMVFSAFFLVMYREGMTGSILTLAVVAVLIFVFSLVYEDVMWWEVTQADLMVISMVIFGFTMAGLMIYEKQYCRKHQLLIGLTVGGALAIGIEVNFIVHYNLAYLFVGFNAVLIIFLIINAIRQLKRSFVILTIFAIGCYGYFMSVGYIFDNIMEPHQQTRIKVALNIEEDYRGNGYNVDQSKVAIGSGGLWGKGFLQGTQTKLNYVPEQATDFIFCTVGEEQGFVGSVLLLLGYTTLILRLCVLAERQDTRFGRVYGYSVASILLFHLLVNVGMVIGLVPVIGIPLPFFSYGGSSLWGFSLLIFVLLGIDARRQALND